MLRISVQIASDPVWTRCTMGWLAWPLAIDEITSCAMQPHLNQHVRLEVQPLPWILLSPLAYLSTYPEKDSLFMADSSILIIIHSHPSYDYSSVDHAISVFRHTTVLLLILNIFHQLSYSKSNCFKRSLFSFFWNEFFFQRVYSRPASWDGNPDKLFSEIVLTCILITIDGTNEKGWNNWKWTSKVAYN